MKTIKLTIPYDLTVKAVIGSVRIMRGERNMILLPINPLPIVKSEDRVETDSTTTPATERKIEGETIVYASESFSINMGSDVGRRIACDDIRLALPEHLTMLDEPLLVNILKDKLMGKQVLLYKSQQKNDATKYNVRLAPALSSAKDDDLLGLIRSMSVKAHDDLASGGNYPADPNAEPGF